jgi:hypothetical protein
MHQVNIRKSETRQFFKKRAILRTKYKDTAIPTEKERKKFIFLYNQKYQGKFKIEANQYNVYTLVIFPNPPHYVNCEIKKADINNDGNINYILIYYGSGTGNYSGIEGVYTIKNNTLERLPFADIVVKNLFPGGDMSHFYSHAPKIVKVNDKTYLQYHTNCRYYWQGNNFTFVSGNRDCIRK